MNENTIDFIQSLQDEITRIKEQNKKLAVQLALYRGASNHLYRCVRENARKWETEKKQLEKLIESLQGQQVVNGS